MLQNQIFGNFDGKWLRFSVFAFALTLGLALTASPLHAQYTYTDLYDFSCTDSMGCVPVDFGQLTQGADGNLYGTAQGGGLHAFGTIFMVTPQGAYSDLWSFDGITGENPGGGLTLASDGNFYGTADDGGAFNEGTVFRFTPPSTVTLLHSFDSTDGGFPVAAPIQGADGDLYGVTLSGGVYKIVLADGSFTFLSQGSPTTVYAPLVLASDGNLYGVSASGGKSNGGTVFRVTTPKGAIKVLYSFKAGVGDGPVGPLVQAADGNLYGTVLGGGTVTNGQIFKITLSGQLTILHTFDVFTGILINHDGAFPEAGVVAASDGYLYGVTGAGGANASGTIYQISTTGSFSKLFDFPSAPIVGNLATTLMQHTNSALYSVTADLGTNVQGNFYSLSAPFNFSQILKVAGPIFVLPGTPVELLGNSMSHVVDLNFGSVQADFRASSDTQLTATVPLAAVDATIGAIFDTGLEIQTQSAVHILPLVLTLDPLSGSPGTQVTISGGGFNGATQVKFAGVQATSFTVVSPTTILATVPSGFQKGKVKVITPNGRSTSEQKFTVE